MTVEACYAKLSYLIGKVKYDFYILQEYSPDKIKKMLSTSLRGELTDIKR